MYNMGPAGLTFYVQHSQCFTHTACCKQSRQPAYAFRIFGNKNCHCTMACQQSGKLSKRIPELVGSRLCAPVRGSGPRMLPTQLGCQAQPLAAQHAIISCCLHCIPFHVCMRSFMMLSLHWLCLVCCCANLLCTRQCNLPQAWTLVHQQLHSKWLCYLLSDLPDCQYFAPIPAKGLLLPSLHHICNSDSAPGEGKCTGLRRVGKLTYFISMHHLALMLHVGVQWELLVAPVGVEMRLLKALQRDHVCRR
jgi:hypothetical protein